MGGVVCFRPPLVLALVALVGCGPGTPSARPLPAAAPGDDPYVTILGEVRTPQRLLHRPGLDLRTALHTAGGLTPLAYARAIRLRRKTFHGPAVFVVSADDEAPVWLARGDVVYVGARDD